MKLVLKALLNTVDQKLPEGAVELDQTKQTTKLAGLEPNEQ